MLSPYVLYFHDSDLYHINFVPRTLTQFKKAKKVLGMRSTLQFSKTRSQYENCNLFYIATLCKISSTDEITLLGISIDNKLQSWSQYVSHNMLEKSQIWVDK